ncbi:putative bifunctional diguanylate cyclase/phosphodiesterase [Paucibacter sp. M5-1]|uniref:putative bifunctional diguanylate cyclase/phosphodiesterase n=1 Tax=Paucibacter sp. M5-1 TaxID=3015998 RepID=UPI0022B91BB8|nr:EAL domain-containing protein [Paucibacter sp. M5-1]MCZ7881506.1 EAL domain-containing protein [Paucibacter sp. M5-1]
MSTLPAFLNLRRLEGRIVALFLALLLVVQLASFAVIRSSIERNANGAIAAELKTGERVLRRLLAQEAVRRGDAAELLAKDYGFKEAIGLPLAEAGTVETIRDALSNQGERIGASVVVYADNELKLVAATREDAGRFLGLLQARVNKPAAGDAMQLALLDGQAYQVVVAQVRTPAPVGWVLMGFALDAAALQDLKSLSDLRAVVVIKTGTAWRPLVSNFDSEAARSLAGQIPAAGELFAAEVDGEQWRGRFAPLLEPQQALAVVLLRSFDEAIAPYRQLQLTLLALTLIGVGVFALGAVLTARRISGPIKTLSDSAERLGRGDYETPVRRHSSDEVGDLADAFEAMRQGVRSRDEQVHRLAFWDPLTGLPNREQFSQQLAARLARDNSPRAVLMLDLDRFKHVNDVLGHAFGDRLLCSVAQRLQALHRDSGALLARLGGDEFVLLLDGADQATALAAAARIQADFEAPLHIDDQTVDLGAGIGIALAPEHGREVSQLLARAELAMYAAKRRQHGSMVYEAALDAGSQESLSLLGELRRAIEGQELRLYLQPKVDLRDGTIVSAEALVRWQHPVRGLVPPMQFIPFAEQTGFIRALTAWVIEESARLTQEARRRGMAVRISVNLSTRDLMDQELPAKIMALLARHGAAPADLCLEITESAIMDDPQRALTTLERLAELGFKLSIDDFGTGYSSLAYLKRLPVNELKIDSSFVMAMERDLDDAKIVRSTIELAHNLGLSVVAEGVETGKAWKLLAELGCDEGQGYFIGRPVPASQFMDWLPSWQPPDLSHESLDTVMAGLN